MATARFRMRFEFWLDMLKPDEEALASDIELLKSQRSYVKTIRDGIRLIISLRNRQTDVLYDLFPFLTEETSVAVPVGLKTPLESRLNRIEQLLEATSTGTGSIGIEGNLKSLQVPQFDAPLIEDDDFTLDIRQDTSSDAVNNFLNSVMSLQQ